MSTTEILNELPHLTATELLAIQQRLMELKAEREDFAGSSPSHGSHRAESNLAEKAFTVADFVRLWQSFPSDPAFADDLESVNRADQPLINPWDS